MLSVLSSGLLRDPLHGGQPRSVGVALKVQCHVLLCLILLAVLGAVPVYAQFETAVVVGRLSDATGAAVPNAEVKLTNVALGTTQTRRSSPQGEYEFAGIPAGAYIVVIEAAGFQTTATSPITVEVGARQRADIQLKLGPVSQDVTVSLAAPQLETDSSERSLVIDAKQLNDLPLNGRHYTDLALLAPGVQLSGLQDGSITQRLGSLNVNGMRSSVNNFLLDGLVEASSTSRRRAAPTPFTRVPGTSCATPHSTPMVHCWARA